MGRIRSAAARCVFLLSLAAGVAPAKDATCRFDAVRITSDTLSVDVSAEDLLDRDTLRGLRKGMTAGLEYQIQLWEKRKNWFDALIAERTVRMKIGYDNWERKFRLERPDTADVLADEDGVRRLCGTLAACGIVPSSRLSEKKRYRFMVRVVFQPMSMENMQEIKRWLSGEADNLNAKSLKAKKSPIKSAGDWLLGFLVNVSGFGDRVFTAVSPVLVIENGNPAFRQAE